MKFRFSVFLILSLSFSYNLAFSVTTVGCWVNGQDKIFTSRILSTPTLNTYSQATGYKVNFSINDPARANDCNMANPTTAVPTGKTCTVVGEQYNIKGEYTFTYISCVPLPLDDYLPFIVFVIAITGALHIKQRRQLV